jgi:hypothetical protein
MTGPFPTLNYWCIVSKDLDTVAEALALSFQLHEVEFDAEDLFEWFTASGVDGSRWNVSRRHNAGETDYCDRVRIVIAPVPHREADVGQRLADALSCPVCFGKVTYIKGDEWAYDEQETFSPSTKQG